MAPYEKEFHENYHRIPNQVGTCKSFIEPDPDDKSKTIHLSISVLWFEQSQKSKEAIYIVNDRAAEDVNLQGQLTHWLKANYHYIKLKLNSKELSLFYRNEEFVKENFEDKYNLVELKPETALKLKIERRGRKKRERSKKHYSDEENRTKKKNKIDKAKQEEHNAIVAVEMEDNEDKEPEPTTVEHDNNNQQSNNNNNNNPLRQSNDISDKVDEMIKEAEKQSDDQTSTVKLNIAKPGPKQDTQNLQYQCLACKSKKFFDFSGKSRHEIGAIHISNVKNFFKKEGYDKSYWSVTEKVTSTSKGKKKKKEVDSIKESTDYGVPALEECECGEDARLSKHQCDICKRFMHAFCGIQASEADGFAEPRRCMYCINADVATSHKKKVFGIVRKLARFTKIEEVKDKLVTQDKRFWKDIEEINNTKMSGATDAHLDELDAVIDNLK